MSTAPKLAPLALIAAGAAISAASPARAALLAYEPFNFGPSPALGQYTLGDENAGTNLLGGQNPIIGPTAFYSGGWVQSGGDSQVVKDMPSLSYPGLATGTGGLVEETIQFGCCSFGRSGRAIAGGLGFGPAKTIYESFLIDFGTQGTDDPTQFGLRAHELWNGGVGESFKAISLFVNHFAGVNVLTLEVTTPTGTSLVPVLGGGNLTQLAGTHLVVIRYTFTNAGPDQVRVYLDPIVGDPEPAIADAFVSIAASNLTITHQGAISNFVFSGSGHIPGAIDEIRWGDTFADVTPPINCGPADIDGDGDVDSVDLNRLLEVFGCVGPTCPADLNDDNIVSSIDLNIVLGSFGCGV